MNAGVGGPGRAWVVPAAVIAVLAAVIAATTGTSAMASTPLSASSTGPTTSSTTVTTVRRAKLPDRKPVSLSPSADPVRVMLVGDSLALTLGLGLSNAADQKRYGYTLFDNAILGCGVADGPEVEAMGKRYTSPVPCNGAPPAPGGERWRWQNQWRAEIRYERPNVVMLLAGRWEVVDRE
jgi:hypothetical protein